MGNSKSSITAVEFHTLEHVLSLIFESSSGCATGEKIKLESVANNIPISQGGESTNPKWLTDTLNF